MHVYLDDLRVTPPGFDTRVFTYAQAVEVLSTKLVKHISLDHDLDAEGNLELSQVGTGYDVARWIEEAAYNGTLPQLTWAVHSQNPPGAARIRQAMENATRYWTTAQD